MNKLTLQDLNGIKRKICSKCNGNGFIYANVANDLLKGLLTFGVSLLEDGLTKHRCDSCLNGYIYYKN